MIKKFIDGCLKQGIINVGEKIVVAVSGGADSIALADLLHRARQRFKLELTIAHYEHGLRGADSIADADFVKQFARDRSIDCIIEHGDVQSYAAAHHQSIETAARNLRHDFLERVRSRLDYDSIALAHHADDQAETILMRLIRGTGSTGLSAMSPRANRLIRPLLNFRKVELEDYCRRRNLQPRIDATNFDPIATRNKIRLELIPLLTTFNPSIVETLCRLGSTAADDAQFIEEQARKIFPSAIKPSEIKTSTILDRSCKMKLSQAVVKAQPVAVQRALIRMFLANELGSLEGIEFVHIEGVRRVITDGLKGVELPNHVRVNLSKKFISIEKGLVHMKSKEDYIERVLFTEEEIGARVAELGKQISEDYAEIDSPLLTVGILNGAAVFFTDLVRKISIPVQFDFMNVSSYDAGSHTSGKVNILKNLETDVRDRHILLIEDIIDSGTTMKYLLEYFRGKKAASVKICSLLNKPSRRKVEVSIDYCGFDIPDEFIVGYGLDFAQHYRNLPYLGVLRHSIYEK
ncbi:MAG: hypoxanthine phosphoribosyltransferase [Selenomonadaceae bacterium]|nr:hypoxanthine phosphoribosyltransferase [Selenomonadaceae bacterium]